nr:elongator complex protein 5-like isoform X1 [Procambarus clarkii]XP_045617160.1 elongator complex protein 5-like isoform X1 [Procambarus clarkii]
MSKTNVGKIFRKTEIPAPRTLLLTDTSEVCGRGLLYALVNSHLRSAISVLYLSTSLPCEEIKQFMKEESSAKIEFLDVASDPCGWDNDKPEISLQQPLHEIFRNRHIGIGGGKQRVALVIDKLEDVTRHQDSLDVIRSLHLLSGGDNIEQLILYCGRDIMPESTLSAVCHITAAVVHVLPTNPCSCRIILRKPSGKIIKVHEEFSLTQDLQVQDIHLTKSKEASCSLESANAVAILAAQTTFNLSLTDDQRVAKNNLLLPHTRIQSQGGEIHYTPDDVDDWDEEDPDDDLNI